MAEYEATGVSGKQAYTVNLTSPSVSYMKVDVRTLPVGAAEDVANGVLRIERQGRYETVAASQTDQVLGGTGAAGDYLEKLILVVTTALTAAVSIKDGAGSAIAVFPNSPGGGVGTYVVPMDILSTSGAWSVTTGAGVAGIAVGRFT